MRGAKIRLLVLLWFICLPAACSSSGDNLGGLQESLEDRLTDALEFDSDELRNGAPPAGEAGDAAPQLTAADIPGGMAVETGFIFRLDGAYKNVADIKKAVVFVYGASRYFLVDVLPLEVAGVAKIDLIGRLGQDDKLIGEKFTFKLALMNGKGLVGRYIDLDVSISAAIEDRTLDKLNLFDDEYHESGRPEGSMSESAPQISAFSYPAEVTPGGDFRLNLRTSFYAPELIKSAVMSTPHSPGYREYFTDAVTMNGKLMGDSLVVVNGSFSDELEVGSELVFIVALRQDNGETGMYRSFAVKVVEKSDGDVDIESDSTDGDGDASDGDMEADTDGDSEPEDDVAEEEFDADMEPEGTDAMEDEREITGSEVVCNVHCGVAGAALDIRVGLQKIDTPLWLQDFEVELALISNVDSGGYVTYKYKAEAVPAGQYRAVALISAVAGSFGFPDNFYWSAEGPQVISNGKNIELNIWAGVSSGLGVVENVTAEINAGVNIGTNYTPRVYAILTMLAPESLELAFMNVVALRRISAGVNGLSANFNSIPPGTYFLSLWIDRCVALDTTQDVFSFSWNDPITVPQPIPSVTPEPVLNLSDLNCPGAPATLTVPGGTSFGLVPTTGGMTTINVSNSGTSSVLVMSHAASAPFYSNTDEVLPILLNAAGSIDIRVSVGSGSAGLYDGVFYLLINDPQHPTYSSNLQATLVK